jgi:hypothetical protein
VAVQVDLLKNSGLELIKRMNEITHLQLAVHSKLLKGMLLTPQQHMQRLSASRSR